MKIIAISDTHNSHSKIPYDMPDGDVLVFAGDMSIYGHSNEIKSFNRWLGTLDYKHKIVIAGNHDIKFQTDPHIKMITNADYLEDDEIVIDGIKFYGTPWTPEFCNWAFMLNRGYDLRKKWEMIPDDTDILITHGPPRHMLDLCPDGLPGGCDDLLIRVQELNIKHHIFGHIHSPHGQIKYGATWFHNVSLLDDTYKVVFEPTIIEV